MSTNLRRHVSFEAAFTRLHRPGLFLGAVIVVAIAVSYTWTQTSTRFFDFSPDQYWAVIATQGGAQGWPPLFAYVLALYGVAAWRYDATGESAYVAMLGFADRWRTVTVRIFVTTGISIGLSVASWAASIATALIVGSPMLTRHIWSMVLLKGVWTVVCGLTFCQVGAMLCVAWRSRGAALMTLLAVPWLVEPVLTQLLQSTSNLSSISEWSAYLPFTAFSAILGGHTDSQLDFGLPQLAPHTALYYCSTAVAASVGIIAIRYCRADGEHQREV